ncbi:MAG: cytochrome c-type biogenesis protein CcmH [bacterium]|nr:cytochrome c-type biogenesis protein CcmH [bacterium]
MAEETASSPAINNMSSLDPVETQKAESLSTLISDTVMSPYCPGRTLSACPSYQARELREKILDWTTSGQSKEEIEQTLVTLYGFEVLGVPSDSPTGLLGWYAPLLFVVTGGILLVVKVRQMLKNKSEQKIATPQNLSIQIAEIEQQLKERLL